MPQNARIARSVERIPLEIGLDPEYKSHGAFYSGSWVVRLCSTCVLVAANSSRGPDTPPSSGAVREISVARLRTARAEKAGVSGPWRARHQHSGRRAGAFPAGEVHHRRCITAA
jgi:hypothetical protein